MFHPYLYIDHDAVNIIFGRGVQPVKGIIPDTNGLSYCFRVAIR